MFSLRLLRRIAQSNTLLLYAMSKFPRAFVMFRRVALESLGGWIDYIPVLDHEGLEQQKLGRRRHMVVAYAERAGCKHPILDGVAARTLDLDAGDNRGPFRAAVVDSYTAAVLVEGTLG